MLIRTCVELLTERGYDNTVILDIPVRCAGIWYVRFFKQVFCFKKIHERGEESEEAMEETEKSHSFSVDDRSDDVDVHDILCRKRGPGSGAPGCLPGAG